MTDLFNRDATLTIGTLRIRMRDPDKIDTQPTLRIAFKIERQKVKHPDKAEISVYNLSRTHRSALSISTPTKSIPCSLDAGYVGATHTIFSGDLHFSQSQQNGTDWISTFQSGDGLKAFKAARINVGIKPPVTPLDAIQKIAGAMGLNLGNVTQGIGQRGFAQWASGFVASGKAELQMDKVMKALGCDWFIQNNTLHALGPLQTLAGKQLLLSPEHGLIGSPQSGDNGMLKVRSLLQPDLMPGYSVQVQSSQVSGQFRIEKATFTGDTHGQDWYTDMELRPLAG